MLSVDDLMVTRFVESNCTIPRGEEITFTISESLRSTVCVFTWIFYWNSGFIIWLEGIFHAKKLLVLHMKCETW